MTRPVTDLQRRVAPFTVRAPFQPSGDQPEAIRALAERIRAGEADSVLLGANPLSFGDVCGGSTTQKDAVVAISRNSAGGTVYEMPWNAFCACWAPRF